jgi:hypothetical protein
MSLRDEAISTQRRHLFRTDYKLRDKGVSFVFGGCLRNDSKENLTKLEDALETLGNDEKINHASPDTSSEYDPVQSSNANIEATQCTVSDANDLDIKDRFIQMHIQSPKRIKSQLRRLSNTSTTSSLSSGVDEVLYKGRKLTKDNVIPPIEQVKLALEEDFIEDVEVAAPNCNASQPEDNQCSLKNKEFLNFEMNPESGEDLTKQQSQHTPKNATPYWDVDSTPWEHRSKPDIGWAADCLFSSSDKSQTTKVKTRSKKPKSHLQYSDEDAALVDYIQNLEASGYLQDSKAVYSAAEPFAETSSENCDASLGDHSSSTDEQDSKDVMLHYKLFSKDRKPPGKKQSRSKRTKTDFPSASLMADVLEQDPYGGFDIMDWNRPSLRSKRSKGRKANPILESISDEELAAQLDTQWRKDRLKKKARKEEREERRAEGQLGKGEARKSDNGGVGMFSLQHFHTEIRQFLESSHERYVRINLKKPILSTI